jgi:AcrR family transcriptional regulator
MIIPVSGVRTGPPTTGQWTALDLDRQRERLLHAAAQVFAQHGLDAPMSEVAAVAGVGVASVYRRFASKRELLAALVVLRLDQAASAAWAAGRRGGDRWSALTAMLRTVVERQDDFLGEARAEVADHPEVIAATERAGRALDNLLDAARAEGRLRPDATTLDLRLLFAATRAARQVEPGHWPRMLELMIDALDSQRG